MEHNRFREKMAVGCSAISVVIAALLFLSLSANVFAGDFPLIEGRHNLTEGSRVLNDMLLFHDNPTTESKLFPYPKTQSYDVCYPDKDSPEKVQITYFTVIDQGEGGYAFKHKESDASRLCLHLKTQRGKGYNFAIDVYGYKK